MKLLLLVLCLLSTACAEGQTPLEGSEWTLVSLNGKAPIQDHPITIQFNGTEVGGSAGCNGYGGQYEVEGTRLQVRGIGSTQMACLPEAVMDQEEEFHRTLQQVNAYRQAGDRLDLMEDDGQPVLVFERAD